LAEYHPGLSLSSLYGIHKNVSACDSLVLANNLTPSLAFAEQVTTFSLFNEYLFDNEYVTETPVLNDVSSEFSRVVDL